MAIREVLRMGHPVLRKPASPVPDEQLHSPATEQLLQDMVDTLHAYGGIGLAAPQIGVSWRLAIVEIPGGPSRYGDIPAMPLTVFVNPEIRVLDPETAGYWEGCLSVPGLRGYVERPQHIQVRYQQRDGTPGELVLRGFLATVFQHEFDHLDGKLYVDRMTDMRRLVFEDQYQRFVEGDPALDQAGL